MEMIKIKNMNNSFMLISRLDMQKNTSVNLRVGQYKSKNKKGIEKEKKCVQELWCNIRWFSILGIGVPGEERMWVGSINNILRKLPKAGNLHYSTNLYFHSPLMKSIFPQALSFSKNESLSSSILRMRD